MADLTLGAWWLQPPNPELPIYSRRWMDAREIGLATK